MIQVTDLCFSYQKKKVLEHLNLHITKGRCVGIVGANGCGKSTLLAILSGALKPHFGTITFLGNDTKNNHTILSTKIGYVPQEPALIPELSVKDNITLWFRGNKKQLQEECKHGFIQLLGIYEYWNQPIHKLSGGMKKRVSIGCALVNHPTFLILDEPSAALDLPCKKDIHQYLSFYMKNGGTVLITTHDEKELDLCDNLFVLKNGQCQLIDTTLRGEQLLHYF